MSGGEVVTCHASYKAFLLLRLQLQKMPRPLVQISVDLYGVNRLFYFSAFVYALHISPLN